MKPPPLVGGLLLFEGGEKMNRTTRRRKPAAHTPTWNSRSKAWDVYDHNGNRLTSMKPLSDDLIDILNAFILADRAAAKYTKAYMDHLIKKAKWAA